MAASLAVTPLPAPVGSVVAVIGSGFNNRRIRLLLDGVPTGDTFRASKAGSFTVGLVVAKTARSQVLTAETYYGGKWSMVARLAPLLTFTPPGGTPTQDPILTNVGASNITSTTALISWTTNIPSDTRVEYDFDGPPYTISGYYDAAIALTPIWYCRLGEPSGTTATDVTGTPDNGTYTGSPTLGVAGALGSDTNTAVTFNGSTQYVSVPDVAKLDVGDTFSIAGWFKRAGGTGTARYMISKGNANFALRLASNNRLTFQINGSSDLCDSGPVTVTDNGWHHVVATKNGATHKLYLDGVDVTSNLGTATAVNNATDMNIGRDNNPAGSYWNGSLDDWGIWNSALTAGNVGTLYAARNGGGGTTYNPALVTTHAITLSGLTPSTGYHYRVVSVGPLGTLTSSDYTFTSAAVADTTAPVITNVAATSTIVGQATVTWTTDELASGVVDYGLTSAYGSQSTADTSFTKTSHTHTINGAGGSTQQFRVRSSDAAGNQATSQNDSVQLAASSLVSIQVDTMYELLTNITDNSLDEIVVTDGVYNITSATGHGTTGLWIGGSGDYPSNNRTRPLKVRAETPGGVIFDGNGFSGTGIAFEDGAHDQWWDGFVFRDFKASGSAALVFGGFYPRRPVYNLRFSNFEIEDSVRQVTPGGNQGHSVYIADSLDAANHDIIIEDFVIASTGADRTHGGIHAYHPGPTDTLLSRRFSPYNITVRRGTIDGVMRGLILYWDYKTDVHDWLWEDITITNCTEYGVEVDELAQAGPITLRNITSSGSGINGYDSSIAHSDDANGCPTPRPGGYTFTNCTLN